MQTLEIDDQDLIANKKRQPNFKPRNFACHEFTLLNAKEKGLREFIMAPQNNKEVDLIEYLIQWGYTAVSEPKSGDFVLYFDKSVLTHSGKYLEDGWVESKFGNNAQNGHHHPLHVVPQGYGTQIAFFRKTKQVRYKSIKELQQQFTARPYSHLGLQGAPKSTPETAKTKK